ncbi:MFS transporter [Caldivirga maquilingensis]|uniref:Major facilitator superfamily MFS_1 n=1 Tax=Caldivirga maquilingensis (strain ATCC 700844 / DSM 13496 / JCM 10307 / IC-167) TaxID=397948 RepID=A8ME06_CALMQ|nr:MFS transporter [Caldivirga maquilingensis]ABW02012.1 major facilitator superfamily MFS_1 [Caldivirga maquilingensis IC-167]
MKSLTERRINWMMALMPYSIAIGPLGTLLTLEIASLKGTPIDVSYAMSAGSAAGVAAPLIWGFLLDRYGGRRVLTLGFLGSALFMLALAYSSSIPQIALYYAAASLFSSAVGVSASMIIVGYSSRSKWSESYSSLNFINSLGYLIGDLAAAVLSGFLSIKTIILSMGLLSLASVALTVLTMPREVVKVSNTSNDPPKSKGRVMGLGDLVDLIILYSALIIFYISSGIFNTLYPYGLRVGGLSKTWVMGVISMGLGVQIMGFKLAPRLINRLGGNAKAASSSLILRGLSYSLIGLTSSTPVTLIATGLTLYPLAAGLAFSTFYTASNVMIFERLKNGKEGRGLGVYNVVTGSAYLTGSLTSGYLANSIGIGQSYVIAGVMLWGSAYLFRLIDKSKVPELTKVSA